jgi:predicted DNA-binding transcriptional regulator AlpA
MIAAERPVPRLALNRTELAVAIGVSTDSVDAMVSEGALPRPRRWHKRKLWLVAEVEAFLTELPADGQDDARKAADPADEEDWSTET